MKREIKAPSVGESITEVRIGSWKKQDGEAVRAGDPIIEIESDKATVEVVAEFSGALQIGRKAGETVRVGELLGVIDEGAAGTVGTAVKGVTPPQAGGAPSPLRGAGAPIGRAAEPGSLSPAVRRLAAEHGVDVSEVSGSGRGGRVTKGDMIQHMDAQAVGSGTSSGRGVGSGTSSGRGVGSGTSSGGGVGSATAAGGAGERRVPMSLLRLRIAERLVQAQQTAAILTTFNECDMTEINAVRAQHKEAFKQKHGVALSFMSFFTRAVIEALKTVPAVNAMIDGTDIVYRDYYDVGIAVGTDRGLVVPVLRDVGKMGFVDIENGIGALAAKARDGKLSIKELSGGTFTISNGGVYGSLLSTPILNPPQSGILGMHKIQDRPMAVQGRIEIRPMMYLALSYDHRLIDGREAVTFLIKVKEGIENPKTLGMDFV